MSARTPTGSMPRSSTTGHVPSPMAREHDHQRAQARAPRRSVVSSERSPDRSSTRGRQGMSSVWSYEGMRVVVSGGGGAGMGAATVTELADRGAEIHVLDLKEPPVDVASYQLLDLKDPQAAVAAIETIGGPIHALFNCAGLPGPPFSDLDTMIVNFVAMRHLAELSAARMTEGGAIASI